MTPLRTMLRCNGFDENFDGSRQLEDADLAYRLGAAGLRVVLDSSIKVTEFGQARWENDVRVFRDPPFLKCNGAYFYPIMHQQRRFEANRKLLSEATIETFVKGRCPILDPRGHCSIGKGDCLGRWRWGQPEDTLGLLQKVYRDERPVFDLVELRKQRSWELVHSDPMLF
jgi:hypothetical protein